MKDTITLFLFFLTVVFFYEQLSNMVTYTNSDFLGSTVKIGQLFYNYAYDYIYSI